MWRWARRWALLFGALVLHAESARPKCLSKLKFNLMKDCKWTPNATGAPQRPPLQKGYVPGCFQECYEDFEFFENVQDVIRAGPPSDSTKMSCDTSERTGYLCKAFVIDCVRGDKSLGDGDFPNSCSSDSFGKSDVVGAGHAPGGETWVALYAYSNYVGTSAKGPNSSQRILAARVMFRGIEGDDAGVSYDGMCEGTFEVQPGSPCFGVDAGDGALHVNELPVAPLPPPRVDGTPWPLPEHVPTPTPAPETTAPETTASPETKTTAPTEKPTEKPDGKNDTKPDNSSSSVVTVFLWIAALSVLAAMAFAAFYVHRSRRVAEERRLRETAES
ncbi:unnamed protein product [Durusdinium trenchii]|uniref:Uncharacterized protein n=2 Tax=Durusdinium trenchii TaxID=1381693 RepID=A0ABP0LC40_9DINO